MNYRKEESLLILTVLHDHATKQKPIERSSITFYLETDHNEKIGSKALGRYLEMLMDRGFVECHNRKYCIRPYFTLEEIQIILEALYTSRQIPRPAVKTIINKIGKIAGHDIGKYLKHLYYIENVNYTENTKVPEWLGIIDDAIERNCMIRITTCGYDMKKNLKSIKTYEVSPYYTYVDKSRYYLLCHTGHHSNGLEARRLDRISNIKICSRTSRKPLTQLDGCEHFEISTLTKQPYMFISKPTTITLMINKHNIGDFIDWFGKDFSVLENDGESAWAKIRFQNCEDSAFYWFLQYGEKVIVKHPASLVLRLYRHHVKMVKKYKAVLEDFGFFE
ncbi:MAG: WYL domain-containing protein [Lachnospiraceae bacterium]|nr:WYL domain-containing protein [Lachnospiraceae bacterium]